MPVAYNEQSGEAVMLTPEGQWVPTKIAENPETGERLAFDGQGWQSIHKPGLIESGIRKVKNFVTGDNSREFDLPELMSAPEFKKTGARALPSFFYSQPAESYAEERDKLGQAYSVTPDVKAQADIAIKTLRPRDPNVALKTDKFGNPIVTFKGNDYYVNRPGASQADAATTMGQVAMYTGPSRLGMAFGGIPGVAVAAAGAGATSLGSDVLAQKMGSDQPVDLQRAAVAAAGGAAERAAGPIFDRIATWLQGRLGANQVVDPATGQFTARAQAALREAGIDPASVSDDMAAAFARRASQMPNEPAMAARVAEAESLPVPVRPSQGQVSGLPQEQMFENEGLKGVYGEQAQNILRGQRAGQREALQGNIQAIQQRLGGGAPSVAQPGQGAQRAQQALAGMRETERQGVDQAYNAARASEAVLRPEHVQSVAGTVRDRIAADHDLLALPRTSRLVDQLDELTPPAPEGGQQAPVYVRQLFDWRKRATSAKSMGGEEAVALRKATAEVDRFLRDAADNALVYGDEQSIDLFRNAIRTNQEFAGRFKGEDLIQRLTEREGRSGAYQLAVAPDQAANVIFGSSKLFGGANTARDLTRLRDVLGPESPQWAQLREEAWLRLVRAGEGAINPSTGMPEFSGVKFSKALNDAVVRDREIMRTLFSDDEIGLMQQFKRVASMTTGIVTGGANFSNTASALSGIVQNLIGRLFVNPSNAQRMLAIPLVRSLYQSGMGLRAIASQTPRAASAGAPFAIGGPIGATVATAASRPRERAE